MTPHDLFYWFINWVEVILDPAIWPLKVRRAAILTLPISLPVWLGLVLIHIALILVIGLVFWPLWFLWKLWQK